MVCLHTFKGLNPAFRPLSKLKHVTGGHGVSPLKSRAVNEPRMIEIQIFGISLKIDILLNKWTP